MLAESSEPHCLQVLHWLGGFNSSGLCCPESLRIVLGLYPLEFQTFRCWVLKGLEFREAGAFFVEKFPVAILV